MTKKIWIKKEFIQAAFIFMSLLATIKIYFFHMGIDEEYAVTMAYRITSGDILFLDMWEPHQTSGFLSAFLIRIFVWATGSLDYLVLFLRVAGSMLQATISIFLYQTCKRIASKDAAFVAAIFFYNILPKWIQSPEFANMLIWFSTLAFLCLLRFYIMKEGKTVWLVLSGISLAGMVLSYPSSILAVPVFLLAMRQIDKKRFRKAAIWLLGTCLILGMGYLFYFLQQMSVEEFLYGLGQMMTDGTHQAALSERLLTYGREILILLPHVLIVLGITAAASVLLKRWFFKTYAIPTWKIFLFIMIMIAQLEQVIYWMGDGLVFHYPLIYFYLLYIAGIIAWLRTPGDRKGKQDKAVFWLGSIAGGSVWLSGLLITNTTISVTGSYLMIGLLGSILLLDRISTAENTTSEGKLLKKLAILSAFCLLGSTLFAKGYMVIENRGIKSDIFLVRQKALSGPGKGIYFAYLDGYYYNQYASLAEEYIREETSVLYVGEHNLNYLLGNPIISTPSTISTPTYDERLLKYWDRYPERYPQLVITEKGTNYLNDLQEILELGELIEETDEFLIYQMEVY